MPSLKISERGGSQEPENVNFQNLNEFLKFVGVNQDKNVFYMKSMDEWETDKFIRETIQKS